MGIFILKGFQLALRWSLYINAKKSYKTLFLHVYPLPQINLISKTILKMFGKAFFLFQFNCPRYSYNYV